MDNKKRALVTGGTKGIGKAIACMLLEMDYHVTITYGNDQTAANRFASDLTPFTGMFEMINVDQCNTSEIHSLASHIKSRGKLDCLILNAGITLRKSIADTTDEDWMRIVNANINNNFFLVRDLMEIIPHGSRIIFIGSLMAIHPHATSLAYAVTKAAIHAMAQNLVKCFEATNTTVNVIAPGFVETEWQKSKPQHIRQNIYNKTAVKRFASPQEIADAVRFCIGNPFVNGATIEVSGGYCFK